MALEFSLLERTILKAKGLTEDQLAALGEIGAQNRADFEQIGTTLTLLELLPDLDPAVAARVLEWAVPKAVSAEIPVSLPGPIVVEASDAVYCANCHHKQPKDYTPGDLCVNCGRHKLSPLNSASGAEPATPAASAATAGPPSSAPPSYR